MAFEEQLPKWENEGTEPPQSKQVEGWQPNEKPPASWFNWLFGRAYKALKELQEKAASTLQVEDLAGIGRTNETVKGNADALTAHLDDKAAHDITRSATLVIASATSYHKEQADYVCDGINDHVEFQEALDALPANGGRIVMLEGEYNFSDRFTIPPDTIVEGQGSGTIIMYGSTGSSGEIWNILNNSAIKSLTIDGGGFGHAGLRSTGQDVIFEDCVVKNFGGIYGIRLDGENGVAVRCVTEDNSSAGLDINRDKCIAIACIARRNGGRGIGAAETYKDRKIIGCISIDNDEDGITLTAATDSPSDTRQIVSGCTVANNGLYGINLPNAGIEHAIIDGCHIFGNVSGQLNDAGTNTIIGNNYIEGA